mmetsp:Transcript_36948/g.27319  ORF Transcript_36948/g.27319 Transcript_36948/m.27319 type:complete len:83 (+) Transcript_36948:1014-1262(+)
MLDVNMQELNGEEEQKEVYGFRLYTPEHISNSLADDQIHNTEPPEEKVEQHCDIFGFEEYLSIPKKTSREGERVMTSQPFCS